MKKQIASRFLALVLTALMLVGVLPIAVWAETSAYGYRVENDGTNDYAVIELYEGDGGVVVVPEEIDGYPVKAIGYGVFSGRQDISHVTLPFGLEYLHGNVFSYSSVMTITIPESLKMISSQCFFGSELKEIYIPAGVTSLGFGVFEECHSLVDVVIEADEPSPDWDERWADGCLANIWMGGELVRERVEQDGILYHIIDGKEATVIDYVGDYWVDRVVVAEEVNGVPVTKIGANAFKDCQGIHAITLPDSVTEIGDYAFVSCREMQSINLPLCLQKIGDGAFMWCVSLAELNIPRDVSYIGSQAFYDCYACLNFEAVEPSADWNEYWQNSFGGAIIWEACVHRNISVEKQDATCYEDGYVRKVCDDCLREISYETLAGGHSFEYGVCVICGEGKDFSQDYSFWIDDMGYAWIDRYYGTDEKVAIPAEIGGFPVVAISNYAFEYHAQLTHVIVPDCIEHIGYGAFRYCYDLTEITIPASVAFVDGYAFEGCHNLQSIHCEASERPEAWVDFWLYGCRASVYFDGVLSAGMEGDYYVELFRGEATVLHYYGNDAEIVIPAEILGCPVTTIGMHAFTSLTDATSIVIPDSVKKIDSWAFGWNEALTEIVIPLSVETIYMEIFTGCHALQNIYCEASERPEGWNDNWANGCNANIWFGGNMKIGTIGEFRVEYNESGLTIISYIGEALDVVIPSELDGIPVTEIAPQAFYSRDDLTSVTIPDTVTRIGYNAFSYCQGLTEITIPASVEIMENGVFWDSHNLQNIYCEISEEPDSWEYDWAGACPASIWFGGVLTVGVIDGFHFRLENGCVTITDYEGDATDLIIPETIGGNPVTTIDSDVFSYNEVLHSVVIPETVTKIENGAFFDCPALTIVQLPTNLQYIGYSVFAYCESLTEITIPASVSFMGGTVFDACYHLQNIYCEASEQPYGWNYSWADGCNASIWFGGVLAVGVVDGLRIVTENGEVYILGYVGEASDVIIPSVVNGLPVVAIRQSAFHGLSHITSVVIPDSVVHVGNEAFAYCENLTEVTIGAGVMTMEDYVFSGCGNLQNIFCKASAQPESWYYYWSGNCPANIWFDGVLVKGCFDGMMYSFEENGVHILDYFGGAEELEIPDEIDGIPVVHLREFAFSGWDNLKSVTLPDSLLYIGYESFAHCNGLTEITIPESVIGIDGDAFWDCCNLRVIYCEASARPDGWSEWWTNGCDASVYFDGVLTIGVENGFRFENKGDSISILGYVGDASDVVIPAELYGLPVTKIEMSAFSGHEYITSVVIPHSVTEIGFDAFWNCTSLTEITIPDSVKVMGNNVFQECRSLQVIYCEASAKPGGWAENWATGCPAMVYFGGTLTIGVENGLRFELCDGFVSILGCTGDADEVVIPAEIHGLPVTRIEAGAFRNCEHMTSVIIPETVTFIGYEAFAHCNGLTEVFIPSSVIETDNDVFWYCNNLKTVYVDHSAKPYGWSEWWTNGYYGEVLFVGDAPEVDLSDFIYAVDHGIVVILDYQGNATELEIPAEIEGYPVTTIAAQAFVDCDSLVRVIIPDGVTVIGTNAFMYCDSLEYVTIPASVQIVGYGVFLKCASHLTITCDLEGPGADWNADWLDGCSAQVIWERAVEVDCAHDHIGTERLEPTCGAEGYERFYCLDCGEYMQECIFPATGEHELENPMVGGPDCEGWSVEMFCKNCDYFELFVVPATGHRYGEDGWCYKCGESNVDVVLSMGSADAKPGETFTVDLLLEYSEGFTFLYLDIFYDTEALELVSVTNGELVESFTAGLHYIWANWENIDTAGTLCTLTFKVKDGASEGEYEIGVSVIECSNEEELDVSIGCNSGTVNVADCVYGDANGDGKVNGQDVTRLLRYLASFNPMTGESSVSVSGGADANGDGKINGQDGTRLLRYLASFNPVTGESSVTLGPSK